MENVGLEIDWEERRYELVKSICPSMVAWEGWSIEDLAKEAIKYADELVKQLKENNCNN